MLKTEDEDQISTGFSGKTLILIAAGVRDIIGIDRQGIVSTDSGFANPGKHWFAHHTNPRNIKDALQDAVNGTDERPTDHIRAR